MNVATVQLSFSLNLHGVPETVTPDQIAEAITRDQYSDGRYPFHAEMMYEGVRQVVRDAIRYVVENQMFDKFRNEMIVSEDGSSSTSRAMLEANTLLQGMSVFIRGSVESASVTEDTE